MPTAGQERVFQVRAEWDPDARVWVATSEDVPGLVTEADTVEALMSKLRVMVPELLEDNGLLDGEHGEVPFELLARRQESIRDRVC
jgi:predicted RNase H-like HicB family nuclease